MFNIVRSLFNKTFKHKRLYEDWTNLQEPVEEGVTFICKWLGVTAVEEARSEASISQAIRRIIQLAKVSRNKPQKVGIHVSANGIVLLNTIRPNRVLRKLSIYNISFCCTDAKYEHVFAYVVTVDRICECHAFLCRSSKMAQNVAVSIAHAFNIAYESWKSDKHNKSNKEIEKNDNMQLNKGTDQKIEIVLDDSSSTSSGNAELHCLSLTDDEMKSDSDSRMDINNINENVIKTDRFLSARKNWISFDDSAGIQGEFCKLSAQKSPARLDTLRDSAWTIFPMQSIISGISRNKQPNSSTRNSVQSSPNSHDLVNRNISNGLTLPLNSNTFCTESIDNFAFLQSCISPMSLQETHTGPTFNWTVFSD